MHVHGEGIPLPAFKMAVCYREVIELYADALPLQIQLDLQISTAIIDRFNSTLPETCVACLQYIQDAFQMLEESLQLAQHA